MGLYSLVQHPLANVKTEIRPPVGRIQPDPPFLGFPRFGNQLAVPVQHAPRVGRKKVGNDVPGLHNRQQIPNDFSRIAFFRVADMHHQAHAGFSRRLLGQTGHLHPHNLQGRRHHTRLHPADHPVALLNNLDGAFQVNAAGRKNVGSRCQPGAADMQKGNNLRRIVWDNMGWKTAVGIATAAPSIHHRGNAGAHTPQVGVHAIPVDPFVYMGVQVNQPRGNILAANLNHPRRLLGSNVRRHRGYPPPADGHIIGTHPVLRRVNHRAAFNEQVIHQSIPPWYPYAVGAPAPGNDRATMRYNVARQRKQ